MAMGRNVAKDSPIALLAKDRFNKLAKKKGGKELGKRASTSEQKADKASDAEAVLMTEQAEEAFKNGTFTKNLVDA
ncbi:UNVERIFIED_CONTAM: hypothetical protein HDU68_006358, partial [Siphonaria sp. JEL0065]